MRPKIWTVSFLILIVLAMWLGSWLFISYKLPNWEERSAFGDAFGAIGALFSGLAFAGLIVTIVLQLQQLDLQSQQLKGAESELKRQKEELELQGEILRKQRFEDTFFQLLKLQSEIVNTIDIDIRQGVTRKGRDCFFIIYNDLYQSFKQINHPGEVENERLTINQVFQEVYHKYQADLMHYFNHLHSIINFVHSSERPDKDFYANLVIAQLSAHEQLLLFYYGLSDRGLKNFKPLIEKYGILQNIPRNDLLAKQHVALYSL